MILDLESNNSGSYEAIAIKHPAYEMHRS